MAWLAEHLEEFVKPRLGFIPKKVDFFTQEELTIIKNVWRSAKRQANGRKMLLAGRDTFVFEILARREHFPTTFRPDISRATVNLVGELERGRYTEHYLLDTGFQGTIAKALRMTHFGLASANPLIAGTYQIFPHLTGARSLALKIEATPKYWKTAQYKGRRIIQEPSELAEFEMAAAVTIQVFTNSAPKFNEQRSPVKKGRWQSSKYNSKSFLDMHIKAGTLPLVPKSLLDIYGPPTPIAHAQMMKDVFGEPKEIVFKGFWDD